MTELPLDGETLLIAARDHSRTRRTLFGRVGVEVRHLHALLRETIDVGRIQIGRAVCAEVAVPHVIGDDEDDVRSTRGTWLRSSRDDGERREEQRSSEEAFWHGGVWR